MKINVILLQKSKDNEKTKGMKIKESIENK